MNGRAFDFVPLNRRDVKPRKRGLTEIRGPYYTPMGRSYLSDVLETMGHWIDGLKYAGGSFTLMPRERVRELNALAHAHDVKVSISTRSMRRGSRRPRSAESASSALCEWTSAS